MPRLKVLSALPANVEETLLRIGQEALSNALKHAHPTEFHIRLCFKSDAVRLELFANGKGFVVGQTNGGVGLLGMKERAEQIGAALTISSEPGKGRGAWSLIVHRKGRNI